MTRTEELIQKLQNLLIRIQEKPLKKSSYTIGYYKRFAYSFGENINSIKDFITFILGVLDEKSYEDIKKDYNEILNLTEMAITIFEKNFIDTNGNLKSIPILTEKMAPVFQLESIESLIQKITRKNKKKIEKMNIEKKEDFVSLEEEKIKESLYSPEVASDVSFYLYYQDWTHYLSMDNISHGYQKGSFNANLLMYVLENNLNYNTYLHLSVCLDEDYDLKITDFYRQECQEDFWLLDNAKLIQSMMNDEHLSQMDTSLLRESKNVLTKLLIESIDNSGVRANIDEKEVKDDIAKLKRQLHKRKETI